MTRYCKCDAWPHLAHEDYPFDGFLFCPYCGVRLVAPCWHCAAPSDGKTGNTLYYYEEHNFCTPECMIKFGLKRKETV